MIDIGFDIGGTNIKAGIINHAAAADDVGELTICRTAPYPGRNAAATTIDILEKLIYDMLYETGQSTGDINSIGIASPGSLDIKKGVVINAYNLGMHDMPIIPFMQKRFPGIPLHLLNDADAAALAEYYQGIFKGFENAVLLTLGTGIGGGIILGGRLFTGGLRHGTEPGHMTVSGKGKLCTCGNNDCAEIYCNAGYLIAACDEANAKAVFDRAKSGDKEAALAVKNYIQNLSVFIANITNLLDPEIIALGGGISEAGNILYDPLIEQVQARSFFKHRYKIVPAQAGNRAGIIGAAMYSKNLE